MRFFHIREARRLSFCVLVHRGVRGSRPYFGFLYSLISTNYHIHTSPKVPYLGLIKLENRLFSPTWQKKLSEKRKSDFSIIENRVDDGPGLDPLKVWGAVG